MSPHQHAADRCQLDLAGIPCEGMRKVRSMNNLHYCEFSHSNNQFLLLGYACIASLELYVKSWKDWRLTEIRVTIWGPPNKDCNILGSIVGAPHFWQLPSQANGGWIEACLFSGGGRGRWRRGWRRPLKEFHKPLNLKTTQTINPLTVPLE